MSNTMYFVSHLAAENSDSVMESGFQRNSLNHFLIKFTRGQEMSRVKRSDGLGQLMMAPHDMGTLVESEL